MKLEGTYENLPEGWGESTYPLTYALDVKVKQAHDILDEAWYRHIDREGKTLRGVVVLFSGGNDSTVLAHLMRERATHFAHANTTIGIEATRQFVRDTAAAWGVPLIEKTATGENTYRALVLDQGFPGPGHHWKMYQRLKERQLRQVRAELVSDSRQDRVIFMAGRRAAESARRTERFKGGELAEYERDGSVVWCSPLLHWTDNDLAEYRRVYDVPRNPVTDMIHMSGECLCGAFATPGEREEIAFFYPEWLHEIEALERDVRAAGHAEPRCIWGWGANPANRDRRAGKPSKSGPLCSTCADRQMSLWSEVAAPQDVDP